MALRSMILYNESIQQQQQQQHQQKQQQRQPKTQQSKKKWNSIYNWQQHNKRTTESRNQFDREEKESKHKINNKT